MIISNKAFIYKKVPQGWPVPGQDLAIEDLSFDESAPPPVGGITTRNLYASLDPAQRGRMRDPTVQSYSPAMETGKPVVSVSVIAKVLKSDTPLFREGDIVIIGRHYTESYSVIQSDKLQAVQIIKNREGVPLTAYMGALGWTGLTAYGSLHELGQLKKGDVILVSAAAGAVGQIVGQAAKLEGLQVIGSVGDDRKLEFITNNLGFHGGFNYKKENMADAIKRLAPNGLDIYYDNVGGELLDAAIENMKDFGRIIACGSVSQYNNASSTDAYRLKNYAQVVRRRLTWRGFLAFDPNITQHREARDEKITRWIQEGVFHLQDHCTRGMDNAVDGFLGMLKGENLGKSIVWIQDP